MLSYILLELNLLLYNVHVLEVSRPERQLKHAVLNKLNPYIMGYAYRSSHGSNITDEYNMPPAHALDRRPNTIVGEASPMNRTN
jgi:hypothetical protein